MAAPSSTSLWQESASPPPGATITRSHYPLHPAFIEAFDKYGILYWVDAPVYQVPNGFFNETGVRYAAKRAVTLTVRNNINHPSIMTWSLEFSISRRVDTNRFDFDAVNDVLGAAFSGALLTNMLSA